jgi:hypothetical protein
MRLGKDFGFWIKIILAILRAILPFSSGGTDNIQPAGERVARAVLDVAIKSNEDDSLESIEDVESS